MATATRRTEVAERAAARRTKNATRIRGEKTGGTESAA